MTYVLPDGTRMVLLFHSPREWAEKTYDQLRALGCSAEFAGRRRDLIAGAVRS